jgi:predicted nucleic acid-binding protein
MNAIDTNILVYAYDDQQLAKRATAIAQIDRLTSEPQDSVLLWQVACEFIAVLRRWQGQGRVPKPDVDAYCQEVLWYFPLVCPAARVLPHALKLSSKYSLSHWDSLLVAAALEAGVDTLYTEDLQAGTIYESLTIVNPFAECV